MRSVHDNELVNQIRMIRNNTPVRKRKTMEKEKEEDRDKKEKERGKIQFDQCLGTLTYQATSPPQSCDTNIHLE